MFGKVNRFQPRLAASSYVTYAVQTPLEMPGFWRKGTCEEVDCPRWLQGWVSRIDETTELGQAQAHYIRHDKSRKHIESRTADGLTEFRYPPGQTCFRADEHRVRADRPPIYLKRGGDWRAVTSPTQILTPETWLESFAEHQDRLSRAQQ